MPEPTEIITFIGEPSVPVEIKVYGDEAYMHAPDGGGWCAAVTLAADGKTITSMNTDGWYWTDPTTRKAFERAGFVFAEG